MKIETSRKFLDCTIIAYSFLRNGYNYCLANVFRKMEIAYKNGTAFREIPVKEEYGLSMLLASGFSPRLCSQAWKWSLRFTAMTSFLRWSMQTKWYGKSRNGVSFDRLACNRQKETLFLMPYYWDMKGWRATVSCRLDCAIKNGTASCGYKSQPLSARQTKKSPWQYSLEAFQGIRQGFFLPCHSRRKLVWGTRTVFLRRRLTFIQNTRKDENMPTK